MGFEPPVPRLELMARFTVDLTADVWDLGRTSDLGDRRIFPITGGPFHLHFETCSPTYGWLNRAIAVGSAVRLPDAVVYDAYLMTTPTPDLPARDRSSTP